MKQRTPLDLTCKVATKDEVQHLFADFIGEQNKKTFNLRRELFEKVTELQKDIAQSVTSIAKQSDLNMRLDAKADRL